MLAGPEDFARAGACAPAGFQIPMGGAPAGAGARLSVVRPVKYHLSEPNSRN